MSAHSASSGRNWLSAFVAQVGDYLLEPAEQTVEAEPVELEPYPAIAVVSAGRRSGASTVARLLAAELAVRADGAAVVAGHIGRRAAPPSRAAIRLATALAGAARTQPCGRLCVAAVETAAPIADDVGERAAADPRARIACAARYLAPVVFDVPPDGSAAESAALADRVVVVASAGAERALLDVVAATLPADVMRVVNRCAAGDAVVVARTEFAVPDSRLAARAAALGARALGRAGAVIAELADVVEALR